MLRTARGISRISFERVRERFTPFLAEHGIVDGARYERENQRFYDQYKAGELDIYEFLRFQLKPLAEHDMPTLRQWRADYVEEKVRPILLPRAHSLLDDHRQQGDTVVIITATNSFVTAPIVAAFGIPHLLATEPEKRVSLLGETRQVQPLHGQDAELPGRVADNLFWVGRYAERAEFNSRLLRLTLQFLVTGENDYSGCLQRLLVAVTEQTVTHPGFVGAGAEQRLQAPEQELLAVIADRRRTGSLWQTMHNLLLAARSLRDRLSTDTWSVVNDIDDELDSLQHIAPDRLADALDELDNLVKALSAFSGLTQENMARGRGWTFLDMGRRLERAIQTTRLLNSLLVPPSDDTAAAVLMESLLLVVESMMSYRRRYRSGVFVASLLEMVVTDALNPRSLAYQLLRMEEHVNDLPDERQPGYLSDLKRLALESATMVRLADVRQLAEANPQTQRRDTLAAFLGGMSQRLPALSDSLAAAYFQVAETPHQLLSLRAPSEP